MTPEELKELRDRAGLSQAELSRRSGIPVGVFERFETHRRKGGIADYEDVVLEVINEVLGDEDSPKPARPVRKFKPPAQAPIGPRPATPIGERIRQIRVERDSFLRIRVPAGYTMGLAGAERHDALNELKLHLEEAAEDFCEEVKANLTTRYQCKRRNQWAQRSAA